MFQDREKRQKIKNALIISSATLAVFFLMLIIYGLIAIRPHNIEKASKLGQYYEFSSSSLPHQAHTIQKDIRFNDYNVPDTEVIGNLNELLKEKMVNPLHKGRIAILVGNLGLNHLSTELALSLPHEISLGFMPYTASLRSFVAKAQQNGHEIFIYLPFETKRYPEDSPGQLPILKSLSDEENVKRMEILLQPFEGYAGVYGAPDDVFTNDASKVSVILNGLPNKKLKLLTSNGSLPSGETQASRVSAQVIIDAEPNIPAIKTQLDFLVEIAKSGKTAIGYAGSYPVTLYTIKAWLPTLQELGIEIIPITYATIPEVKL